MNIATHVTALLVLATAGCSSRPIDPPKPVTPVASGDGWFVPPVASARPHAMTTSDGGVGVVDDRRTPSGYFHVSKERLAELRARASGGGSAAWSALLANAEDALTSSERGRTSAENIALAYLVTKDKRFADRAFKWFQKEATGDVRDDSYLFFGDSMRAAAIVLNYCADALTPAQQKEITDYLERWTQELWFDNKGTGWGLADAGNNYYCAFVEGTAYAAYALQAAKSAKAPKLVDLARDKIERNDGTLAYLAKPAAGGDWHEGTNYGERAKQRLFSAFSAIASMGGPNYFAKTPFAKDSIVYAAYQVQPGRRYLAPMGDLSRSSAMEVTPYDRDYVQTATYWADDPAVRGLGAWYLREVSPSYLTDAMRMRGLLYNDVVFPIDTPPIPPSTLPLGYRSPGTDWLNARSAWDDGATSLTAVATSEIVQSHAHVDTGSFVIWRGGWQAADAVSYGKSGLSWEAGAHNMIQVPGHHHNTGKSRGLVHYADDGGLFYAQIDASNLFSKRVSDTGYEPMLDEWTRELVYVRPDVLVVYDRVVPKASTKDWSWRVHFANKPNGGPRRWTAANGTGAIAVDLLDGGEAKIAQDSDLAEGGSKAWRLDVAPKAGGRTLALLEVASGAPPSTATESISGPGIQGAAWRDQVVVFSAEPLGRPASLPFTYRIKDAGKRQHTLVDMAGSIDVTVTREPGFVVVRVSAGSRYKANEHGLVRFPTS
ncbi:MAG: hypothetical protein QOI41_2965 [Myxococcales bacterium]|nr:hypothetical protein [Myxococcales bacterium]